eukprot:11210846-Lingulodinium_polyedra.AAC.1
MELFDVLRRFSKELYDIRDDFYRFRDEDLACSLPRGPDRLCTGEPDDSDLARELRVRAHGRVG